MSMERKQKEEIVADIDEWLDVIGQQFGCSLDQALAYFQAINQVYLSQQEHNAANIHAQAARQQSAAADRFLNLLEQWSKDSALSRLIHVLEAKAYEEGLI